MFSYVELGYTNRANLATVKPYTVQQRRKKFFFFKLKENTVKLFFIIS